MRFALILLTFALSFAASAYETDQLTARNVQVPDVSARVNEYVNARLEKARADTEKKIRAGWSRQKIANELRDRIEHYFPFNYIYFGAPIEKWMSEDLAKEGFAVTEDGKGWDRNIYDRYKSMFRVWKSRAFPGPALVFGLAKGIAGTYIAPTFVSNGVRFGADKLSHFFRLGYRYYKRSNEGTDEAAAVHYGTKTEKGGIGYQTSGAFSYADLAANYDGFRFFRRVMGGENPYFVLRKGGKLAQVRPFKLEDYVDDSWDEYLNPCVYQPALESAIQAHLHADRTRVCAEYSKFSTAAQRSSRDQSQYVDLPIAPEQRDPFRLDQLCN